MSMSLKTLLKSVLGRAGYSLSKVKSSAAGHPTKGDITVRVGNYSILMNGEHQLPHILEGHPAYATNVARIAKHLVRFYPDLCLIDVGANVGDTVALVKSAVDISIICIEGDAAYFAYLIKNSAQFSNVTIHQCFLGDDSQTITGDVVSKNGTLQIVTNGNKSIRLVTLDQFLRSTTPVGALKMLKIDTDGYDAKIIRGGMGFIQEWKPVIFFEYDRPTQENAGETGIEILEKLCGWGYDLILFYDSVGRFICSAHLEDKGFLRQMNSYISRRRGGITYYDLCAFHKDDSQAAQELIAAELQRNEA